MGRGTQGTSSAGWATPPLGQAEAPPGPRASTSESGKAAVAAAALHDATRQALVGAIRAEVGRLRSLQDAKARASAAINALQLKLSSAAASGESSCALLLHRRALLSGRSSGQRTPARRALFPPALRVRPGLARRERAAQQP